MDSNIIEILFGWIGEILILIFPGLVTRSLLIGMINYRISINQGLVWIVSGPMWAALTWPLAPYYRIENLIFQVVHMIVIPAFLAWVTLIIDQRHHDRKKMPRVVNQVWLVWYFYMFYSLTRLGIFYLTSQS